MQVNEAITGRKQEEVQTKSRTLQIQKIRNASLIKLYRSKILSLADQDLSPQLLKIMCQDAPVAKENLDSRQGRNAFVKQCTRYYQAMLRKIERSERKGFFWFF
jgi:hypothetical protein